MKRQSLKHIIFATVSGTACLAHAGVGDQVIALFGPDDPSAEQFGVSVDVDNGVAIVGSDVDTPGAAFLYDLAPPSFPNYLTLVPMAPYIFGSGFGEAVSIDGALAIVGAPTQTVDDIGRVGAVFLFDVQTGQQLRMLVADDAAEPDLFGGSVGIDSGTVIVGALQASNELLGIQGAAYVFDAATGQQLHKLIPDDPELNDRFGVSVAISGSVAIVGSDWDDDLGTRSGSAYLFDTTTGDQLHKLLPDDGAAGDEFGSTVAIAGGYAIVGAQLADVLGQDSGAAYLFDVSTGQQIRKITPADGQANDQFGIAVGISGSMVVVGAEKADALGEDSGVAYLFEIESGQLSTTLEPSFIDEDDRFGGAVGIDQDHAIVGAYRNDFTDSAGGIAIVYDARFVCAGDLNADGVVDTADLGGLIGAFGGNWDAADINGDGVVDTADLGLLISVFGTACP